jgi:two-component system phosphate regulon sensor histidine kinase PhoR
MPDAVLPVVLAVATLTLLAVLWGMNRRLRTERNEDRERRRAATVEAEGRIRQLGQERERLNAVLEAVEDGVILVDSGDTVRYANPAAGRILREQSGVLEELPYASLRTLVGEVRSSGEHRGRTLEIGAPPRIVQARAVPLPDGVVLILRDVTETRRVEAMRRDFLTDASHELKTPAASIRAGAETVARAVAEDPSAAARFAAQLERDAGRMSRIITDLLDLSRLEAERPDRSPVSLDRVTEDEMDRMRETARNAGVELESSTAPATVSGSGGDLALMVRNLIDNAIRYTPEGGKVHVRLRQADRTAILEIDDNGVGIPSRDLPRIFERFYRVDPARSRQTGGTGLGLSIAKHVAEGHGGRIEAHSELGRGSTFRVTLPLVSR